MDSAYHCAHLILAVVLASFFSMGSGQAPPEVVQDIFPEIKRVGMTARLDCTVARMKAGAEVQWTFKNPRGDEVISSGTDIQIFNELKGGVKDYEIVKIEDGDRTTYRLVISRLRPEYDGEYECSISITGVSSDKWPRKIATITVLQAPTIRPGSTDSVKLIEKGGDSSLTCDAFGVPYPNITWVRSDGRLLPNGKAIFRGRTLPIHGADVNFSGIYKCVADNNIKPPAISLAQVYVFQEPTVRVLQDSVGQFANGQLEAKLDCIVQGYPTPKVTWMVMDGDRKNYLTDSDKYQTEKQATDAQNLFNGEQWYTLTIKNIQGFDFRDYFCVGTNSKGEGMGKVTLFDTSECQGPLCYTLDVSKPDGADAIFAHAHVWKVIALATLVSVWTILKNSS